MESFEFIVDRKVEVWIRENVNVKAESEEEAIEKAFNEDYDQIYFVDPIWDTCENSTDEGTTIEVMDESYNILAKR